MVPSSSETGFGRVCSVTYAATMINSRDYIADPGPARGQGPPGARHGNLRHLAQRGPTRCRTGPAELAGPGRRITGRRSTPGTGGRSGSPRHVISRSGIPRRSRRQCCSARRSGRWRRRRPARRCHRCSAPARSCRHEASFPAGHKSDRPANRRCCAQRRRLPLGVAGHSLS